MRADLVNFGEVRFLQCEAVRGESLLRIVHQPLAKLRVFNRAANYGSDHLVTHAFLLLLGRAIGGPLQILTRNVTSVSPPSNFLGDAMLCLARSTVRSLLRGSPIRTP